MNVMDAVFSLIETANQRHGHKLWVSRASRGYGNPKLAVYCYRLITKLAHFNALTWIEPCRTMLLISRSMPKCDMPTGWTPKDANE